MGVWPGTQEGGEGGRLEEVQGKGEADLGSQVVEGLLGDRVVEWLEACLAPAQQRMEEGDAVPED